MPGAVFTCKQLARPRRCTLKSPDSVGPLPKSADTVGLFPKSSDTIKLVFLCTETYPVFRACGLGLQQLQVLFFTNAEHGEIVHIKENLHSIFIY